MICHLLFDFNNIHISVTNIYKHYVLISKKWISIHEYTYYNSGWQYCILYSELQSNLFMMT